MLLHINKTWHWLFGSGNNLFLKAVKINNDMFTQKLLPSKNKWRIWPNFTVYWPIEHLWWICAFIFTCYKEKINAQAERMFLQCLQIIAVIPNVSVCFQHECEFRIDFWHGRARIGSLVCVQYQFLVPTKHWESFLLARSVVSVYLCCFGFSLFAISPTELLTNFICHLIPKLKLCNICIFSSLLLCFTLCLQFRNGQKNCNLCIFESSNVITI